MDGFPNIPHTSLNLLNLACSTLWVVNSSIMWEWRRVWPDTCVSGWALFILLSVSHANLSTWCFQRVCMCLCSWCLSRARSPDCTRSPLRTWTRRTAAARLPQSQHTRAEWGRRHWGRRSQRHPRTTKSNLTCNMRSYSTRLESTLSHWRYTQRESKFFVL